MAVSTLTALATTGTQWAVSAVGQFALKHAIKTFAISFALSAISRALAPKPQGNTATGLSSTVKSPTQARPIIYGRTRTAGTLVYIQTTGDDSKYLHMVQAMAGHKIDGYEKIYIDDELAWDNGTIQPKFTGKIRLKLYTGDQTTADADLVSESGEWTNTCVLNDTAYIYIRLEYDAETFSNGIPNITALVRGKQVYNPVTDVTEWTQNPALCISDYINDSKYGLTGINVDATALAESVGVCAQQVDFENESGQTQQHDRYQINGYIDTSEKVSSNIENMLSCMFGEVVYSQGKLHIKAGYYKSPVLDIDESVIVGDITLQTKQSKRSQYNGVKGVFLSSEENYTLADYPAQISSAYALEDGEPNYLDMTLPFTTDNIRAQRLAKLALGKSRQQRVITVPVNLVGLKIKAGDNVRINNSKLGLANAVYQVADYELDFSEQLKVNLVCIETGASLYDWTLSDQQDFSIASDVQLWDGSAKPPTALNATSVTEILTDGTTSVHIDVSWTAPDDVYFDYYVLKFGNSSITTKDTSYRINNVDQSGTYAIEVSAYNNRGRQSSAITTTVNTSPDTTAPSDITVLSISSALQSISLKWTNPTEDDFDLVRIKVADTNAEPTTHSFEVRSDSFVHDIGAYNTTKYYWLAPVDRTGNVGNYVSGGTATTGSIAIGDVPAVAGTFYLTLGNNDAPTNAEFLTAVGRNPASGDFAIVNKEFAFAYDTTWTVVTEFIDGSLLVSESITALGEVTAGTFSLGNGKFIVDSSGKLSATDAIISGNITADSLDVEDATITGTLTAPIGWSNSVYSGVINRGNLSESVKDLIDERIAEVSGGISGDFGQDDGSFNLDSQLDDDPQVNNITHASGKNITIELSGSRSWTRTFIGLPVVDMDVSISIQRSLAGANSWSTIATITDTGSSITTNTYLVHSGTQGYSISIYHTIAQDPASGNYDYRAITNGRGLAYNVSIPLQLTVVEPATIGAGNADTLDNQDGTYYLNYNNFTNTPTIITQTDIDNSISALVDSAPVTLDTLNELAAALGDDANFAQTTATALGTKMPKSGGTFTGGVVSSENIATTGANGTFDVSKTITGNIHFANGEGANGSPREAGITWQGNYATQAQAGIYVVNDGSSGTHMAIATTNSYAVGPQIAINIDNYGSVNFPRSRPTYNGDGLWSSGDFTSTDISNWDTAYTYSQVGHLPLTGGTVTGDITSSGKLYFNKNGQTAYGAVIDIDHVENNLWPFLFETSTVGNDNSSGFWVGNNGYPDMRLRRDSSTVRALISSWETSFVSNGFSVTGLLAAGLGTSNEQSSVARFGGASQGGEVNALSLVNSVTGAIGNAVSINFHNASNYSPTGKIVTVQRGLGVTDSSVEIYGYNGGLKRQVEIDYLGNLDLQRGGYRINGQTVIDSSRNATFNSVTISTGNLNIRTQNEENPTDVIYLGVNNGNSTGTSNDIGTGLVFAPQYTGYTKRSAGIMQIGEGNYFRSGLAFYTNGASNATTDWSERMRIDMDGNVLMGQGGLSYTSMDNTPVVGSKTNNRLHVNGSIQLTNNDDAIVFGRGAATFLKDEELGFGWGGGIYMTDGTYLRIRNNKEVYSTGAAQFGSYKVGSNTVIDASRNLTPNVIDMGSGHAQGYKFHGRSYSWNSAMQAPTSKMPHIWQEDYSGWDPVIGIKTTNGFWQTGAYSSNEIHNGYMAGAYGGHSVNGFDTSWSYTPTVFKIGSVGTMSLTVSGSITANSNITAYSDRRLKDNIKTLDGSKVYKMRGVSFTKDGELGSGVIAQELEKVAPELVMTNDDEMQTKSVAYGNVVGYLIEAIKELKQEIEVLKNGTNSN